MDTAYFSAEASANLLSLGQVQRCGGSYRSLPSMQLSVYDAQGVVLDTGTVLANNIVVASLALYASVISPRRVLRPTAAFPAVVPDPDPRMSFEDFSSAILVMDAAEKRKAAAPRSAPVPDPRMSFEDFSSAILANNATEKRKAPRSSSPWPPFCCWLG